MSPELKQFILEKYAAKGWVQGVLEGPDMLDLEPGMFTWNSPKAIAESMYKSVQASKIRKGTVRSSGISMMSYYVNRAGKSIDPKRKKTIMQAKEEYRKLVDKHEKQADVKGPLFSSDKPKFENEAKHNRYDLDYKDKNVARIYHKTKTHNPSGVYIEPNYDNKQEAIKLLMRLVASHPLLIKQLKLTPMDDKVHPTGLHKGLDRLGMIQHEQ